MTCRCGHEQTSTDPHPCHADGYRCRKPATRRFYGVQAVALAGAQMKYGASETWACDECWAEFKQAWKAATAASEVTP